MQYYNDPCFPVPETEGTGTTTADSGTGPRPHPDPHHGNLDHPARPVATAKSDPATATRTGTLRAPCDRNHCTTCVQCKRFRKGDRIELSQLGIIILGNRMVGRGTVCGQVFTQTKHRIALQVHWDTQPKMLIATIEPPHIQHVFGEAHAFI